MTMHGDFDAATMGGAFERAGNDSRQWNSIGIVENATGSAADAVDFTNGYPLVNVRLHPSDIAVRCRVAGHVGGVGEGEWYPFVAGDEVIVAIPQGDERAGGIITGRLNNGVDTWPKNIANQDMTSNAFAGRKTTPTYLWELGGGWMLFNNVTTAQLALDAVGGWLLASGDHHFLKMDHDGITIGLAASTTGSDVYLKFDESTGQIRLAVGATGSQATLFTIDKATTLLLTKGVLAFGTSGLLPSDHIATAESVVNVVSAFMTAFATFILPLGPITGPTLAALLNPAGLAAIWAAAIPLASAGAGFLPTDLALLQVAFAVPRVPTINPGVGVAGFTV